MNYIIIAYKPDSADYCRNCLMASYSSDFELREFAERDNAVEFIAEIIFKNAQMKCNEKGYEIHFVTGSLSGRIRDGDDEWWEWDYSLKDSIMSDATTIADKQFDAFKIKQAEQRRQAREYQAHEKEKQELAQLAELQKKYQKQSMKPNQGNVPTRTQNLEKPTC